MSLSFSIDHLSTTVEDVSVEVAAKTEMVDAGTTKDSKKGQSETTYSLASGDNAYPADVIYRTGIEKRASGPVRHIAVTFNTWAASTDSVSGLETRKRLSGTVTLNVPADMTIEVADIDDVVGNLFSFLYPSVTTKVRSTTWLQRLLYGTSKVV